MLFDRDAMRERTHVERQMTVTLLVVVFIFIVLNLPMVSSTERYGQIPVDSK